MIVRKWRNYVMLFIFFKNIRESAKKFNDNTFYLPDSVNKEHFKYKKNERDFSFRAVWSGTTSKSVELLEYMDVLKILIYHLELFLKKDQKSLVILFLLIKIKPIFQDGNTKPFQKYI